MLQQVADIAVLGPAGELDRHEGRLLLEKIKSLMGCDRRKIILDLGEVNHIHYRFLSDLLPLATATSLSAGGIKLANMTSYTRELLRVAGADRFFETYDSVADAILSFDPREARTHSIQ